MRLTIANHIPNTFNFSPENEDRRASFAGIRGFRPVDTQVFIPLSSNAEKQIIITRTERFQVLDERFKGNNGSILLRTPTKKLASIAILS